MYFDGQLSLRNARASIVLYSPTRDKLRYAIQLLFKAINMAEYEGLIARLRIAASLGIQRLLIKGDSQLIVNETSKAYQSHEP